MEQAKVCSFFSESSGLDKKLATLAQHFELPLEAVREVCLLHRKQPTSNAYWERWNQLQPPIQSTLWPDGSRRRSFKRDPEGEFYGVESELSFTPLLLLTAEPG